MAAIRAVYEKSIRYFEAAPVVQALFKRIIQGDDRGEDFEEAIQVDRFFTMRILQMANEALRIGSAKSLSHAVVLLGKDPVRDYILGHSILRKVKATVDSQKTTFSETHPLLQHGRIAETQGRNIGYEHIGIALAAGYIFDVFEGWMRQYRSGDAAVTQGFEELWKRSLRRAQTAHLMAQHYGTSKVIVKKAFPGGLLIEVGTLIEWMENSKQPSAPIERAEKASLMLTQTGFLQPWESLLAFYSDHSLLKFRDFETYELIRFLKAADILIEEKPGAVEKAAIHLKRQPSDIEKLMATLRKNYEF